MNKSSYWINDIFYEEEVLNGTTIFQKCAEKNIDLPCFCYHESLSIAGNCRMCLVEVSNSVKLVVSCAMPLLNGNKIYTMNYRINKARENVLELLLINHPLDCPICDQGGECDLQDITLVFGSDKSRFYEYNKRAVFDKNCGYFVKTIMTRCIHCTRCVRFLSEISETNEFGMLGRGSLSEISTYIHSYLNDELSGNIIDLCPVGALTSKPYAFSARPWELNSIESIDVLDSLASNIRVDYMNNKIYKILPIYDKLLNEDWITNKARFSYDSFNLQRLYYPHIKLNNKFIIISWWKSFFLFFEKLIFFGKNHMLLVFCGLFSDIILLKEMKSFFNSIGTDIFFDDYINSDSDFRYNYLFNCALNDLDNYNNFICIGLNLRLEMPILNIKIKKMILNKNIFLFNIGFFTNFYYNNTYIYGNSFVDFINILKGKNAFNLNLFNNFCYNNLNKFLFLFGSSFFFNKYSNFIFNHFNNFLNKYLINNFLCSILNTNLGYLSLKEFGLKKINQLFFTKKYFVFLEEVDNENFLKYIFKNILKDSFVVYHGSYFDIGSNYSDLLLPSTTCFEYDSFFINLEGKIKKFNKVITNEYKQFNKYEVFIGLGRFKEYKYKNNFSIFKIFNKILKYFFFNLDWSLNFILKNLLNSKFLINKIKFFNNMYFFFDKQKIIDSNIYNIYKTNIILKNSKIMHLASLDYMKKLNSF